MVVMGGEEPVAPVNQMHATDHVITASTVALLMQAVGVGGAGV